MGPDMTLPDGVLLGLFAAISLLSAALGVLLVGALQRVPGRGRAGRRLDAPMAGATRGVVVRPHRYVFRGGALVSPIDPDDVFLHRETDRDAAFGDLAKALAALHPDLPDRIAALAQRCESFLVFGQHWSGALLVEGRADAGSLVIAVVPVTALSQTAPEEPRPMTAVQQDADRLRHGAELVGTLVWQQDPEGRVTWANASYRALADLPAAGAEGDPAGMHVPPVFGDQLEPPPLEATLRRCQVQGAQPSSGAWYEVSAIRLGDGACLFAAQPVDRLVAAEDALREFVQTLSKTFATLPTGLAVFDRKRELVMFNPALVAISGLEPGFLSNRPSLRAFLDRLRDRQRMPEPRDYRTWREEIARLEQGAAEGRYHELWTLPGGDSLRVTGHPHPDGAIAFLFDDISQEMVLTRQFRSDLELDRSILNDVGAAFVVFDRDGRVTRANASYRSMFGLRSSEQGEITETLTDAAARWQEKVAPARLWGDIRMFVRHEVDRAAWAEMVPAASGPGVHCRVAPLAGGLTIIWFLSSEADRSDPFATSVWPDVPSRAAVETRTLPDDRKEGVA
jgi:PAS domain-containing protein